MTVVGKVGMGGGAWAPTITMGNLSADQIRALAGARLAQLLTPPSTAGLRFLPADAGPMIPTAMFNPARSFGELDGVVRSAITRVAGPAVPTLTLEYRDNAAKLTGVPNNLEALVSLIIAQEQELENLRTQVLRAEEDVALDLQEAHGVFQKIVNRQAAGSYGRLLLDLVASGYATIEVPHRRVNSSWEKGAADASQRRFGLSRKISGQIPDRFPTKLVVHTHNSYTGGILSASIKDLATEESPGGNRMIESAVEQLFAHESYRTWMQALKLPD